MSIQRTDESELTDSQDSYFFKPNLAIIGGKVKKRKQQTDTVRRMKSSSPVESFVSLSKAFDNILLHVNEKENSGGLLAGLRDPSTAGTTPM